MIPKNIHYIWLGNENNMPKNQKGFIDDWRRIMPEYKYFFWNEETIKKEFGRDEYIDSCLCRKQFAFAADYIRLMVLFKFGGIYFDTDVKVLKNFDCFLHNKAFLGFHYDISLGTATIGCESKNKVLFDLMKITKEINKKQPTVNNEIFTQYFLDNSNFLLNGKEQLLNNGWHIYPRFYFEKNTAWYRKYQGGFSRHYPAGSWRTKKKKEQIKNIARLFFGEAVISDLNNWYVVHKSSRYLQYKKDSKNKK